MRPGTNALPPPHSSGVADNRTTIDLAPQWAKQGQVSTHYATVTNWGFVSHTLIALWANCRTISKIVGTIQEMQTSAFNATREIAGAAADVRSRCR